MPLTARPMRNNTRLRPEAAISDYMQVGKGAFMSTRRHMHLFHSASSLSEAARG